jgi:hypothetical protein
MTKVALRWTPEGKRKRGRPKTTWRCTIENEIRERGHNRKKSQQRLCWRFCSARIYSLSFSQVLWKLESVDVFISHSPEL